MADIFKPLYLPAIKPLMKKTIFILNSLALLALASCGGSKAEEHRSGNDTTVVSESPKDTSTANVNELARFKFDFAIGNTPSPAELVNDMSTYNLKYSSAFLADVSKASGYKTDYAKALNLGIYNLDMSYAIANGQGSDVLKYMKTSMTEIDALGMKGAFDQLIGKRTETNINNKDSLLNIIDELYVKGDSYLRSNQRVETATYIFIGSWIEALHMICSTGLEEKDPVQKARIHKLLWEQRFHLKNIIELLAEFKDSKEAKALKEQLEAIHKEIDSIPEAKEMTNEKFAKLAGMIAAERKKITG